MAAFDYAMAGGCDGFEFDVRYTRDRRSVLSHDPKLNRKEVAITDYSGFERRGGHNLACLEDVLTRFGGTAYLDIELKVTGNEEAVVAALRAKPPRRGYVVSSFLPDVLLRLAILIRRSLWALSANARKMPSAGPDCRSLPLFRTTRWFRERLIDEIHAREKKLLTWTVNDAHDLLRLAGWGVDGLISDDPRLLARTFPRQRGAAS